MRYDRTNFPQSVKEAAWKRCRGHCEHPACRSKIMSGAIYDHIIASTLGGPSTLENCQVLCARCNRLKTSTEDIPAISKAKRIESKRANFRPRKPWPKRAFGQ